jgi:gamma-D-glutamyl-L-lysine dipeptidyl-peptidase
MQNIVSLLPVIPVRSGPSDKDEMVTQMIFGEHAVRLERYKNWSFVEISEDSYNGWVYDPMIQEISEETAQECIKPDPKVLASLFLPVTKDLEKEPIYITAGSLFYNYEPEGNGFKAGGVSFTCMEQPAFYEYDKIREKIAGAALRFLNIPYLWGGKNPFGMDCSGLTQTVFRLFGKKIPRDARQQARLGHTVNSIDEAGTGDIAFFDNEEGEIIHAGMISGNQRIIHASGCVRHDRIDQQGIYNDKLEQYTHRLKIIRNLLD